MTEKSRLDVLTQQRYPEYSRTQIQSWIVQGSVLVNDKPITKPGTAISVDSEIIITADEPKYVSRGGLKLERALKDFNIILTDKTALDAGISTGGFTDCLLQNGIKHVYGIDVGYGQVHEKIRTDARVTIIERTNVRYYEPKHEPVDIITFDLSFISLLKVLPTVKKTLRPGGILLPLIKPQFEAEKGSVPSGGVIKDEKMREKIVATVIDGITKAGFEHQGLIESPILGATGNKEYLAWFINSKNGSTQDN